MSDRTEELVEQLRDWFTAYQESEYLNGWEGRADRLDMAGLNRLDKLVPGQRDMIVAAEHDEIWLAVCLKDLAGVATEEDVIYLIRCGILYDSNHDSLKMNV